MPDSDPASPAYINGWRSRIGVRDVALFELQYLYITNFILNSHYLISQISIQ